MARIYAGAFVLAALVPLCCRADLGEDLLEAVRKGDATRVKALLAQGADVNSKSPYGATSLFFAADRGNVEMIKILLDHGADVNVKDTFYGATALTWASEKQRVEVMRLLMSKGAKGADHILTSGVEDGNADMVRLALEHKADIPADTLSTALMQAEKEKHTDIAELLKHAGVQPPVKPKFEVPAETLKSYAGSYSMEGFDLKFEIVDGKLSGGMVGQKMGSWDAIDTTTFQYSEYPAMKMTFNVENGKVVAVTVKRGDNPPMVFKKAGGQ